MKSEDGYGNFPSEWFEFPSRNDVLISESPEFMQILDLEAFSVQSICTLSLIISKYVNQYIPLKNDLPILTNRLL